MRRLMISISDELYTRLKRSELTLEDFDAIGDVIAAGKDMDALTIGEAIQAAIPEIELEAKGYDHSPVVDSYIKATGLLVLRADGPWWRSRVDKFNVDKFKEGADGDHED